MEALTKRKQQKSMSKRRRRSKRPEAVKKSLTSYREKIKPREGGGSESSLAAEIKTANFGWRPLTPRSILKAFGALSKNLNLLDRVRDPFWWNFACNSMAVYFDLISISISMKNQKQKLV